MACLEDKKVVAHNGTDESDPMLDAYQDIQLQNDYTVMQLTAMGYCGNVVASTGARDRGTDCRATGGACGCQNMWEKIVCDRKRSAPHR